MITISNCPITDLQRKLTYDFYWLQSQRKIVIMCTIEHYDVNNNKVNNARIVSYQRALTASDSLVILPTGRLLTTQETTQFVAAKKLIDNYNNLLAIYNQNMITYNILLTEYNSNEPPIGNPPIEPAAPVQPAALPFNAIEEYDFYVYVLGVTEIILPQLIENIILARDLEGKFDI